MSEQQDPAQPVPAPMPYGAQPDPLPGSAQPYPAPEPLPPSPGQQPHPSGPFPAQQPGPVLAVGPGAYPPPSAPPKRKATGLLIALVAVFVVATGTFVTLWFVERGDHKSTQGQLSASRADADDNNTKRQVAEKRAHDAENNSVDLLNERDQLQRDLDTANGQIAELTKEPTPCANAGRAVNKAARAADDKALKAAIDTLIRVCN
jgi:hypothetical protein